MAFHDGNVSSTWDSGTTYKLCGEHSDMKSFIMNTKAVGLFLVLALGLTGIAKAQDAGSEEDSFRIILWEISSWAAQGPNVEKIVRENDQVAAWVIISDAKLPEHDMRHLNVLHHIAGHIMVISNPAKIAVQSSEERWCEALGDAATAFEQSMLLNVGLTSSEQEMHLLVVNMSELDDEGHDNIVSAANAVITSTEAPVAIIGDLGVDKSLPEFVREGDRVFAEADAEGAIFWELILPDNLVATQITKEGRFFTHWMLASRVPFHHISVSAFVHRSLSPQEDLPLFRPLVCDVTLRDPSSDQVAFSPQHIELQLRLIDEALGRLRSELTEMEEFPSGSVLPWQMLDQVDEMAMSLEAVGQMYLQFIDHLNAMSREAENPGGIALTGSATVPSWFLEHVRIHYGEPAVAEAGESERLRVFTLAIATEEGLDCRSTGWRDLDSWRTGTSGIVDFQCNDKKVAVEWSFDMRTGEVHVAENEFELVLGTAYLAIVKKDGGVAAYRLESTSPDKLTMLSAETRKEIETLFPAGKVGDIEREHVPIPDSWKKR